MSESSRLHPALDMKILKFPDGFSWGTATASYQIEGGKGGEISRRIRAYMIGEVEVAVLTRCH